MDNRQLFDLAISHRIEHGCSAYPYEEYDRLIQTVKNSNPKNILEIGTGIGFASTVMAKINSRIQIETIEKDLDHCEKAKKVYTQNNVYSQIKIIHGSAEEELAKFPQNYYDFVFFDGYQIHYEFLPHYERILKTNGILFLANNHLKSKTSDHFFEELETSGKWKILERFSETTITQKIV